jgi:hypothetical protein
MPNAATRELWRIAENGATDELEDVLPQADINARNEHGMTALMRAARLGRLQMARVLLEHGADPNVTRSDNFTALSLAAFFGHSEIVELLMRYGANAEVATRFDTSPYQWAKARSYGDVVRCLEKEPVLEKPESEAPRVSAPAPDSPVVVRTLKEPPEIWDLVHEAPRNFDARSAFMSRVGLSKGSSALLTLLLLVVAGGAITAGIFLKDRISLPTLPAATATTKAPAAPANTTKPSTTVPAPAANQPAPETTNTVPDASAPDASATATEPAPGELNSNVTRRSRPFVRSRAISTEVNNEAEALPNAGQSTAVAAPKVDPPVTKEAEPKKTSTPASSPMIATPKSAPPQTQPPKAKVIQWP